MQLNTLKRNSSNKRTVRIGRGSTRGKTSGRGHKGQKARAGHRVRPVMRDLLKKIPKLRGHGKNRSRTVNTARVRAVAVNIGTLEKEFDTNTHVTPATLLAKGLIRRTGGKLPPVKILAKGTLTKKMVIAGCEVSQTARDAVVNVGGEVL